MSTMLSQRAAADFDVQRDQVALLEQQQLEHQMAMQQMAAEAAALKAKHDRAAARRARGSLILEAHDLFGGNRRVEASVAQRMQALGLLLADQAGMHGEVDAGSLVDLMQRCGARDGANAAQLQSVACFALHCMPSNSHCTHVTRHTSHVTRHTSRVRHEDEEQEEEPRKFIRVKRT